MPIKRGSGRPGAKLNDDLVRQIRINRNGWPRWKWAKELGVCKRTIESVATYQTWKHVK